jgi:ABC-type sugar transport system ATPase subunit
MRSALRDTLLPLHRLKHPLERLAAFCGELYAEDPSVVLGLLARDKPRRDESGHPPGHPAIAQQNGLRQLAHAQGFVLRLVEGQQDIVVIEGKHPRALEIGITIAGGADVILLDEPTAGMSNSETARFINLIREVTVGKTLLTVEHDMGVVFGLADKIAVVVYGEVIAFDTPEAVRANPRVQEAYLGSVIAEEQAALH